MVEEKQKLPKWFNGECYTRGDIVRNRFTGEGIGLTAKELSMYDLIMGITTLMEMGKYNQRMINDHRKGLSWFRKNNPEAYMVLLD
jgi:hypothetical protein